LLNTPGGEFKNIFTEMEKEDIAIGSSKNSSAMPCSFPQTGIDPTQQ
jgi:hypothetical protein